MQKQLRSVSLWQPWYIALLAPLCGLIIGCLTLAGQATLPGSWNHIANSGAVWLVPAFFLAALAPDKKRAALVSVETLLGEICGYYASAALFLKFPPTLFFLALWTGVAIVGGPLAGAGGYWWRHGRQGQHITALAFLGGVFIAEGLYLLINIADAPAGWGGILIGVLIPLLLGNSLKSRLLALLILPLLALLGIGAYLLIGWFALHPM